MSGPNRAARVREIGRYLLFLAITVPTWLRRMMDNQCAAAVGLQQLIKKIAKKPADYFYLICVAAYVTEDWIKD